MVWYRCKTQERHLQMFRGPSGLNYQSTRGLSFVVTDKRDVDYFDSQVDKGRFDKVGAFEKLLTTETSPSTGEDAFYEELVALGVSKTDSKKLSSQYGSMPVLRDDVIACYAAGTELENISNRSMTTLIKALVEDDDSASSSDSESEDDSEESTNKGEA